MNNLYKKNIEIYEKYLNIDNDNLACPNIVSSKEFIKNLKPHPIIYLGQETNGWVNYDNNKNITIDKIEESYDYFMLKRNTSKSIFWQFIKNSLKKDYNELSSNILWTNTILIGKRYSKGHPDITNDIKEISLDYLLFLYEYFEPSYIINVSGPNNPYYSITKEFLLKTDNDTNNYPTKENPYLEINNYIWTYHPNYLRLHNLSNKIENKIYTKTKEY